MASLVVGAAGAFVGSFFGPIGTSIGWSLGAALGNALFPTKTQQPLHDLHLQGSSYGAFIKIIYGTVRVAGNVIWETDLQEHDGGGKGKTPQQSTFTASFDVGLCETQVVQVLRFWAAGRLNYDVNQPGGPTVPFVMYDGNSSQLPDPTEEATEGVGNVPAYRGISRVVFTDWDMTQFGNSIPQLSFELQTKAAADDLRIINSNYATGRDQSGDAIIQVWDGNNIIISGTNLSNTRTTAPATTNLADYDLTTLDDLGLHTGSPSISYPCQWNAPIPSEIGLGNYVYADGTVVPLWGNRNVELTSSDTYCPVVTLNGHVIPDTLIVSDPTKFIHNAGVPDVGYYHSSCMSQDGTRFYIFVGPTTSLPVDRWYEIIDGTVSRSGTVNPPLDLYVWGINGVSEDDSRTAMSAENDGKYFWYYDNRSGTPSADRNKVHIFTIEDSNFAEWSGGTLDLDPDFTGGDAASLRVIGTGTAGIARGDNVLELSRIGGPGITYLDEVVADLCDRAGLASSEYDVTQLEGIVVDGYVIESQITVRAAIESLMPVYFFDGVESDGVLKFVLRGADPIVTFAEDDLAAHTDSDDLPSILSCIHTQDADLPSQVSISYMNKEADYQVNTQTSQRMVGGSRDVQTIQVPLVLTDEHAKKIVDTWLFNAWWERDAYTWYSSRKYAKYEPTDVVIVQGKVIRITSKNEGATGVIKWDGVPSRAANYVQAGAGGTAFNPGQIIPVTQQTQLVMLDIPLVTDAGSPNGFYAAMAGATSSSSWRGASLFKSSDGTTYESIGSVTSPAVIGTVTDTLGDFLGGNTFDEGNTIEVVIGAGGGTLASITELDVLNGSNEFLVGNELIQAKNCVLTAASTYQLSGLLRGRRGTEWAIPTHAAGERFIGAPILELDAPFSELGQLRYYKAVTFGQSLATATAVQFINTGQKLKPYSPAQLGGGVDSSGGVIINWMRRTRIGGAWNDYVDVSLSEASEAYVLQIWDEHFQNVARIVNINSPTFTYTAAMQVTDFGATQQTIFVSVGQVGAYTLGTQATAEIPGAGASNDAIIAPVTPYNNPPPITGSGCSGTVVNSTIDWTPLFGTLPSLPGTRPHVGSTGSGPLGPIECVAIGEDNFNVDVWIYEPVIVGATYPVDPLPSGQLVASSFLKGNIRNYWGLSLNVGDVTPTYADSGDAFGGPDQTWVIKFTTGSIISGRGYLQVDGSGSFGGTFTYEPCGSPLPPTATRLPSNKPIVFAFYMTGNPTPSTTPTLLPSTDYYLCVTRVASGTALNAILVPPNGT